MPAGFWSSFPPCRVHWRPLSRGRYLLRKIFFIEPNQCWYKSVNLWQSNLHPSYQHTYWFLEFNPAVLRRLFLSQMIYQYSVHPYRVIVRQKQHEIVFLNRNTFLKWLVALSFELRSLTYGIKTFFKCRQEKRNIWDMHLWILLYYIIKHSISYLMKLRWQSWNEINTK